MNELDEKLALKQAKAAQKAEKAERKKLYKEYLKAKTTLRVNEKTIICPPGTSCKSPTRELIGKTARLFVVLMAVFAMGLFVTDAFGFSEISGSFLFLVSLLIVAALSIPQFLRKKALSVPATIVALAAIFGIIYLTNDMPNPVSCFTVSFNAALDHMAEIGYYAIVSNKINEGFAPIDTTPYIKVMMTAFLMLTAVIYYTCLARRVRVGQFLAAGLYSAVILFVIFEYNITSGNWGITFVIAAFSAALVMALFDFVYLRNQNSAKVDLSDTSFGPALVAPKKPKKLSKAEKKAQKLAKKAEKAAKRKKPEEKTVDEEISDYFGSKKPKAAKVKLSAEEKRTQKEQKRKEKAILRQKKKDETAILKAKKAEYRRKTDASVAMGGFAGLAVFILMFAIMILPASSVSGPLTLAEDINAKFEYYRDYVTALLMGDDPALDLMTYEHNDDNFLPQSTSPTVIRYTGQRIFTVEANSKNTVYLRGWVATNYDDTTGSWTTAQPESNLLKNYRTLFGTQTDPGEEMMYKFWSYTEEGSIPLATEFDYSKRNMFDSSFGFAVEQISVKRSSTFERNTLYLPTFSIRANMFAGESKSGSTTTYLRARGLDEASKLSYANYFDGIYSSYKITLPNDGYSTIAMVTTMKNSTFYRTLAANIVEINNVRTFLEGNDAPVYVAVNSTDPVAHGWVITLADDTRLTYQTTMKVREGETPRYVLKNGGTGQALVNNDGYKYIILPQDVGNAYYKIGSSGNVVDQYMADIPEDKQTDESGMAVSYRAPDLPLAIRFYECFNDEERAEFRAYLKLVNLYTPYVYDTYARKSSSKIVEALTEDIKSSATKTEYQTVSEFIDGELFEYTKSVEVHVDYDKAANHNGYKTVSTDFDTWLSTYENDSVITDKEVYEQRHKLVMTVIDYITDEEHFTYTLTPELSSGIDLIGVEAFIAGSRQGSCVQFATTAALVLRNMGIPTRYVTGFIATDFTGNGSDDAVGTYYTTVKDSNAHAWIEVWYDNVGWVQYECTPKYYGEVYSVEANHNTDPFTPVDDPAEDEPEDETDSSAIIHADPKDAGPDEDAIKKARRREIIMFFVKIAVGVVAAAAVVVLFKIFVYDKAKKAQKKRDELVEKLSKAKPETAPTREDFRRLCDMTTYMLALSGLSPKLGETRTEYAERISSTCSGALEAATAAEKLSDFEKTAAILTPVRVERLFAAIAAEEFGFGADVGDIPLLARFYRRMYEFEYKRRVDVIRRTFIWLILKRI